MRVLIVFIGALGAALAGGCGREPDNAPEYITIRGAEGASMSRVDFKDAPSAVVTLDAAGKNALLVRLNAGSQAAAYGESGAVTGGARRAADAPAAFAGGPPEAAPVPPAHYPPATAFNADPPPFTREAASEGRRAATRAAAEYTAADAGAATRTFWVDENVTGGAVKLTEKAARLLASSEHADIWAPAGAESYKITADEAAALAGTFDTIYGFETNLLGYEYGGGPGGNGGVDGRARIQIFVYNIARGSASPSIIGYFWAKDEYKDDDPYIRQSNLRSNECEMFYMESYFLKKAPDVFYSTLAHEFQHMIHFNQKFLKNGKSSGVWFDEMCAMLAEDCVSPLIGIKPDAEGHPAHDRLPTFLYYYWLSGVTQLDNTAEAAYHYANVYAFGAYLARNFGGAPLLAGLVGNNARDEAAVTEALRAGGHSGVDFDAAFRRYPPALFNKSSTGDRFNREQKDTVGTTTYTFAAVNLDGLKWSGYEKVIAPMVFKVNRFGQNLTTPVLKNPVGTIPGRGFVFESDASWLPLAGSLGIELARPKAAGVELYILLYEDL